MGTIHSLAEARLKRDLRKLKSSRDKSSATLSTRIDKIEGSILRLNKLINDLKAVEEK